MVKNLIFLGAPGVGKGTMAALLAERKGFKHISTGEIFRKEIASGTKLGMQVKALLDAGEYVPDEITNEIVKNVLSSPEVKASGFILDGYPRTINQAEFLDLNHIKIDAVVLLEADDQVVMERMLGRGRKDDSREVIANRIKVYAEKTAPLVKYYADRELIVKVHAGGPIDKNYERLTKGLNLW